jgi:hypothetical protein
MQGGAANSLASTQDPPSSGAADILAIKVLTCISPPPLEVVNGCLRLSVSQVAVNSVKAECKLLRIDISAIALSQVRDDLHVSLSLFVIGSYSIPIPSGANETRVPAHAYVC